MSGKSVQHDRGESMVQAKIEVGDLTADSQQIQTLINVFSAKLIKTQQQAEAYNNALQHLVSALKAIHGHSGIQSSMEPQTVISSCKAVLSEHTGESEPEPGRNRDVIRVILDRAGHSMSVARIARQAHKEGTIQSKSGYRGVYATVSTTLKRNSKHLFVRLRRGVWDLRSRRSKEFNKMLTVAASNLAAAANVSPVVKDQNGNVHGSPSEGTAKVATVCS